MKKIFILMLCMIFLVGSVSAFQLSQLNDRLVYSNNDLKVSLENWWGLGKTIGTAELKSHKSVDEIRPVKLGESVVMWYDFNFEDLYEDGLGEVEIINVDTGEIIERNYSFVYWGNETYQVPNYVCDDVLSKNGTIGNECYESGTKNKTREGWLHLNSKDIPKGKITIGLELNMFMDETLDVVWKIAGKKIKKHAVVSSGATETIDGDFTILTYTNNGTFNITDSLDVEVLVVAGGGGGGGRSGANAGGGGGGGGIIHNSSVLLSIGNYDIVVGGGGGGSATATGSNGENSSFGNTNFSMVAFAGGGGGGNGDAGNAGGSAGGGGATAGAGGVSNQNSINGTGFGNNGGVGVNNCKGGGGGGGDTVGANGVAGICDNTGNAGAGGNGTAFNITNGTDIFFGGGGGGGDTGTDDGLNGGGIGGGGKGGSAGAGTSGTNETGGGAGGGGNGATGGIGGSGIVILRFLTLATPPTINLDSPANNTNFSLTNEVVMNATIFDETNITNVTLYLNNVGNETNSTSGLNNTVWTFTKNMGQGDTFWIIEACNFNNLCINASEGQRLFSVDSNNPALIIIFPNETINFHEINTNLFVNWSVNDTNLDTCILEYQGVNTTETCLDNQTTINITNIVNRSLTFHVNDTFGNVNSSSVSWNYNIFQNFLIFNTTIFETELNPFIINITYNSTLFTNIDTSLFYNSTKHPTIQTGTGDDVNFSTTLSRLFLPPNIKPFFWNFRLTNVTGIFDINSTISNQVEQPILFGLCNSTLTTPYVNFTFQDEGNQSILTASVPTSTFTHTLGNFTINKTLNFIDLTQQENFTFCLDPPNRTLQTDFSFQYEATGFQQRVVELVQIFNSTLTTNILFLLADADGLFVTFQIINTAEQTIPSATINVSRIIATVDTIVGTGLTNDAGTKTFFLNPNFLHTIRVFKTGFPQFTTTLFPDQTSFTINLGGAPAGGEEDFTQGITVDIFPKGSLLDPNASFEFNLTLTSEFFTVDQFNFGLRDNSGNIFANETASTNGGTLSTTLNVSDNTTIIMDYNWLINGNFTNNSRSWLIFNDTLDSDWSIRIFFTDLTLYIDDGLFGLDDFGLAIITFLTIFIFTGVMSSRFGLASPAAVTTLMFTLVLFFDVGLGLMDNLNPIGAVPNFPTIIMGIILAGVLIKDGIR